MQEEPERGEADREKKNSAAKMFNNIKSRHVVSECR